MNCCVPDFVLEDDGGIFPTSLMRRDTDPTEEVFAELLWHKGPVLHRRTSDPPSALPSRTEPPVSAYSATTVPGRTELFTEEDEMARWLDYPLGDDDGGGGMGSVSGDYLPGRPLSWGGMMVLDPSFHVPKMDTGSWAGSCGPPLPPETERKLPLIHRRKEPKSGAPTTKDSALVGSSVTPWLLTTEQLAPECITSSGGCEGATGTSEQGHTSSSGMICEVETLGKAEPLPEDRKQTVGEGDDSDSHSEDTEFEFSDLKKGTQRAGSRKRSRAAEVHNLSERKRRDRINEKMKTLQQLIPRCNKSDKASLLDDAIEYLRTLQMQVHMMSMGCNMVPMMFRGMQQYVPPMGMSIPMGVSMGMGMGMEMAVGGTLGHPMAPFLPLMSGSGMVPSSSAPLSTAAAVQPFPACPAPGVSDQAKPQAAGRTSGPALPRAPRWGDPCQQCSAGPHPSSQVQVQLCQSKATGSQGTSRGAGASERRKAGVPRPTSLSTYPMRTDESGRW